MGKNYELGTSDNRRTILMPYERNRDLPQRVRDNIPSKGGKDLFRRVFNSQHGRGKSEAVSFASAWAALANAGYEQNDAGKWVKKGLPSASSVHVPSTGKKPRRDTDKATNLKAGDRVEWQSAGGKAQGVITRIVTDGDVPGIDGDVTVTGSEDEPAAQIQILDDKGERTDTTVGHKLSTLVRIEKDVAKAEYDGREVTLDQPFRLPEGASKKFGVYVRDGDEVKRVTFGIPDMEIKRDDPEARESFRARFSCDEATDKTSPTYWSCKMWQPDTSVSEVLDKEDDVIGKRQINDDVFTVPMEARARAVDLGFPEGEIHTHDLSDGQTAYMPGSTHEAYQRRIAQMGEATPQEREDEEDETRGLMDVLREFRDLMTGGRRKPINEAVAKATPYEVQGKVLKVDDEQRMVYGWASVISENGEPVVDTQGDIIGPEELVKAVNDFMLDERVGKVMHEGERTGTIVHSFPITSDIAKSLGLETNRSGWIVGYHVADDDVWKRVKSGDFSGFSIGGQAVREPVE